MSRLSLPLSIVFLAGCAQAPRAPEPAAAGPETAWHAEEAAVAITAAQSDFRSALQAGLAGDAEAAALGMAAALAQLRGTAADCHHARPACDPAPVLDAYEALLQLQAEQLLAAHTPERDAAVREDESMIEGELGLSTIVTVLPEAARSVNFLNGKELSNIIELNGPVKAALEDWLSWMRPNLMEAWENYQFMRHFMWPHYEEAGLPEALLFGILAKESGGKVHAVSRAGAGGPLQFMPATGRRYGLAVVNGFDQRFDPAAATRANVAYLNEQFAHLNQDLELVLAAYNGGQNRMRRLLQSTGRTSFWDDEIYWSLPRETREYVPSVLAAA